MTTSPILDIFCVTLPGMEPLLAAELREKGFKRGKNPEKGGVTIVGTWQDVWRANLEVRGATRILVRIGSFRANHLSLLDKRSRQFPWAEHLRKDVPLRVDVTCRKSRIYHSKAAAQRIETALKEELGATISADAELCLKVRIENDICTFSLDTSGQTLHKRGHKEAVSKAPMRETLAALFLRDCGYDGIEPVLDPMCGSGTFVIEAAEIAMGLKPGRSRNFAFEKLPSFNNSVWQKYAMVSDTNAYSDPGVCFFGSDRDAGAITASLANANRAGVADICTFAENSISELQRPGGPPGLVIINPPYGDRIGNKRDLFALYNVMGTTLKERFQGWRIGLITNEASLAKATGLPFKKPGPIIDHGGLKIRLYQTGPIKP